MGRKARRGSHRNCRRQKVPKQQKKSVRNKTTLQQLLRWFLPQNSLFQKNDFHGNVRWNGQSVVIQAIICMWYIDLNVTEAFEYSQSMLGVLGIGDGIGCYNTFMNALTRYRKLFSERVRSRLHSLTQEVAAEAFRTGIWVLMAVDGSRVDAPRTKSNEAAFCAKNYGSGKTARFRKKKTKGMRRTKNERNPASPPAPQVWVTAVWLMASQLMWTWRFGPSDSSERKHFVDVLKTEKFPENTLFCADAGFVGYSLWKTILEQKGRHFLVRVGANVTLLREHADIALQDDDTVLCWPKDRMAAGDLPLRLRLVVIKDERGQTWSLLTSVLDEQQLTTQQIEKYYQMRWSIELAFRGLKQTISKHTMRCRNNERLLVELEWSIFSMTLASLMAFGEQRKTVPLPNEKQRKRSLAKTFYALRWALNHPHDYGDEKHNLLQNLAQALVQEYRNHTDKRARYRPKNPDKKPLGDPVVRELTPSELARLRKIEQNAKV